MIFVCVGSRDYQFDRLIKEIDKLVGIKEISDEVFAQIGGSDYIPSNIKYEKYLDSAVFSEYLNKSRIVITHGGTGVINNALKMGKQVIGVPRLAEHGEHIDNHQVQIIQAFEKKGYIRGVYQMADLLENINYFIDSNIVDNPYYIESKMADIIVGFINEHIT